MSDKLTLHQEIIRKAIHIVASLIPLGYYLADDGELFVILAVCLAIGFLAADLLRMNFSIVQKYFRRIFRVLLREDEIKNQLTGATYLFLGISLALIVFQKNAAVCAGMMVTLADPVAAIVGKWKGTIPIMGKTLQGSAAFFITSAIIVGLIFGFLWQGFLIAALVTLVELLPIRINDNLAIPIVAGAGLYIAF